MIAVDTNILVHAHNADSPDHRRCRDALESLIEQPETWTVCWGIVYEFIRVTTHPRVLNNPLSLDKACRYMQQLVSLPNCDVVTETRAHAETLSVCRAESPRVAGNGVHDFHYAVIMREHGIEEVLTLDRDFRAFPWIAVRAP